MRRLLANRSAALLVAAGLIPAGCGDSALPEPLSPDSPPPDVAIPTPPPPLPPGVVDEARGLRGMVRVEERDGLRLLTVAGVVQGAAPLQVADAPPAGDPLIALARAARPGAGRALIVGLGTGRTAAELAAAGVQVEVAELEPAVIAFARRYFGYTGHALAMDGLHLLTQAPSRYDLLILDAWVDQPLPLDVLDRALAALGADRERPAAVAIRLRGAPFSPAISELRRHLRRRLLFVHLYGSGVAGEEQNLYLLASGMALNVVRPGLPGLAAWEIPQREQDALVARWDPTPEPSRRVAILGYLIRADEDGSLCLDLPHHEMGAQRYRLTGPEAAKLARLVPAGMSAPTQGDIASDGDVSATLRELLGGGGFKRSDVRFSPVGVALEGDARLLSTVHPDAAARVPASLRGDAPTHPALPYGGALYELEVQRVLWQTDLAGWRAAARRRDQALARAAAAIDRDDLSGAAAALEAWLGAIDADIGEIAARLVPRRQIAALSAPLQAERAALPEGASAFERARACDRALEAGDLLEFQLTHQARAPADALARCAERHYERAAAGSDPDARAAAARLIALLERRAIMILEPAPRKLLEARIEALRRRFPDLEASDDPPPR